VVGNELVGFGATLVEAVDAADAILHGGDKTDENWWNEDEAVLGYPGVVGMRPT